MIIATNTNDPGARMIASDARTTAREAKTEIEELQGSVERLLLITEALWKIVKQKVNCTDAELVQMIHDIDLEDGKLDGQKAATPARDCPHCQRKLVKHQPRCSYCGKMVEFLPFER
jgi:hypothetical protein